MIIQLDAILAACYKANNDITNFNAYTQLWMNDYANFVININGDSSQNISGWAATVNNIIQTLISNRLSQISEPYRYDHQTSGVDGTGEGFTIDTYGWTFKDTGAGDDSMTHFDADTPGGCCSDPVEYQDQVQQASNKVGSINSFIAVAICSGCSSAEKCPQFSIIFALIFCRPFSLNPIRYFSIFVYSSDPRK
jgi:hypothetical protein